MPAARPAPDNCLRVILRRRNFVMSPAGMLIEAQELEIDQRSRLGVRATGR